MKERGQRLVGQKAKDDETLNFVSMQAQEAIFNKNLPESYKDQVLRAAVGTILKIAEKKATYRESRRIRRKKTVYQAK